MTLFRQINSLLFGLFLVVMTSIVYFQFTETRNFMMQQMKSELNNTSTSLGLMLKPHLETGDMVAAETLVNVIFEGGFYRKVTLTWLVDNKQQKWENEVVIDEVPEWFLSLDLFEAQKKESLITSGWMQLATLEIEAHPGFGYRELWRIMNDTLMILSFLFIISLIILRIRLNKILEPLNNIAIHAKGIAERKFNKDMPLPSTSELKDVVISINSMSGQLKKVFNTLDNEVDTLRKDSLVDKTSTLPNRQYFSGQLNSWLSEPGFGGLVLLKLDWLDEIHSRYGFQVRDETIKILAEQMQQQLPKIAESTIARIAKNEFAFLITKGERDEITNYIQSLIRLVNQEMSKAGCEPNSNFYIGVSERLDDMKPTDLLAQSDNALQQAIKDQETLKWFDAKKQHKYTREQWRTKLSHAINSNRFVFQWQPIHHIETEDIIQREVYCRLEVEKQVLNASVFMPYIELLSLGSELDKCILKSIVNATLLVKTHEPLAVNLTSDSVKDPKFHLWLSRFLQSTTNSEKLQFEIPESVISSNLEECIALCETIKEYGSEFGIDQCGRRIGSLNYLQQVKPTYVKLDQSFSFYSKTEQNSELCRALVNVAKGLDIDVIVTAIEDEKQLRNFKPLNPYGYQGYIYPPVEIDPHER
ncbi:EAL domain-containing protein [Psychrobium sp. 1_MG-2023]|uniref:bifunctional diguanylate cyclase/phosphodiesterase n=1 Tax=Psychrobium sp. 1_MG-2023 TaxID=3062624 RepID=UPI000C3496DA|nr:EAL domain-containing protein [Psychrobium sp. 1_MG-2023]MDP2560976.1 EAL domain-containing protein [Psychrobium sp. 1_MG-2023]PKF54952.1 GGDEF domain-containing protein [Alteromonadales bacterium alter-6D02]